MIKVNLISKRRRSSKGRDWTRLISYGVFSLFSLYFLIDTLYVVISMVSLKNQINNVNNQSTEISSQMLKNDAELKRFVLTKLILSQVEDVNKGRFKYKDYLDAVSAIFPVGVTMTGVDFSVKGWLVVTVSVNDIFSFKSLENVLMNKDTWNNNKFFSQAYVEGVSQDKSGVTHPRLQFELKQINGTE